MSTSQNSSGNPILDNPGVSATVFAIVVFLGFVGALYQNATSHHGDAHGGTHNAAPAKH